MVPKSRASRTQFRRAVWASVALHVVAACAFVAFVQEGEHTPTAVAIDTRAEAQVRMSLPDVVMPPEPVAASQVPPAPVPVKPQAVEATPQPPLPPEPASPQVALKPAPQLLPPEITARIRLPSADSSPIVDTGVHQASAVGVPVGAPAIHGPLAPNQTAVYVLDCSGSMGASGKFDAARAALVSTLKQQPASVRFQVIVYTGTAAPLLAGNGNALPATEANIRLATGALAKLDARGASNHLGAVRAALAFRPDVVLLLTDADDLNATVLKAVAKSVVLCVGQVTAAGVQSPRELK